MIVQNQVRCHKCGDEPYSASGHDFKSCKCGNIAVDGGMNYLRRVGNGISDRSYTDLSYEISDAAIADCKEAVKWAEETGRNELGTALAVIRALRKHGLLVISGDGKYSDVVSDGGVDPR
jgi:hypothetical protein